MPLTTGVDAVTGGAGNDTITAIIDATGGAVKTSLTALDTIDGAAGTDTLNIDALTAFTAVPSVTISNVETINVRGADAIGTAGVNDLINDATDDADATPSAAVDFSAITGLNNLNVTQGAQAAVKAAATTDVAVSGITGGIEINGGKTVTVTDAANGNNITVGSIVAAAADNTNSAGTAAAGAITVTDSKQNAGVIQVDGGTTVTVTATSTVDSGAIVVGATKAATGAVAVTGNLNGDGTATLDQGDIAVTGGSSVTVNSNLTITAKNQDADAAHTFGDARVNSDGKTTSVSVNQTYAETEFTKAAVAVVKETEAVKFSALTTGQTTTVDGLTFTASKNLTAAEVAAAFSNLTASDTQTSGGKTANGVFTGALSANYTSGAANGDTVIFTAKDHDQTLGLTAGDVDPTTTTTAGTAAVAIDTSVNTVTYGAVRVDDAATASITTLTVNGYGSADLGDASANDLNALTTLSLANSGGTATVDTSATTLALTVNKIAHAVDLSGAASLKTLNVTATGAASTFGLSDAAVETLTVAGDKVLDIDTGSTLSALKTVTVSGTAGLSIDASGATVTSVNTAATTGTVTATIDGTKATYTGGAGVDKVTLSAADPTKAINLGAGDDSLTLVNTTDTSTEVLEGGDGTDTLVLTAADAETNSAATAFETKINSFERLTIGNAASQEVVDLANLDDISYVKLGSSSATAQVNTVTIANGAASDTFSVVVNGTTYTTTFNTDNATTAAALAVLVDANSAVAATAAAGVITVTASTAGTPFTITSSTTDGNASNTQTAAVATTTANAYGIALNNLANNGTVVLTDAGSVIANIKDATTGTADVLNVLTTSNNNTAYGELTANKVETINITVDDTDNDTAGDSESLTLAADTVTKITVAGAGDSVVVSDVSQPDITKLNLTVTGATALTTVDASAMAGTFTYTANNGTTTVTGGSGKDVLTASGNSDVLIGGAGNDTLTGANLTTLTGGAGNDIFKMNVPTSVNSYSLITDIAAGDVIDFDAANAGTVVFSQSAVTLAGTAVFQDYANAAVNALGTDGNNAAWFQFGGNTYVVQSGNTTAGNDFVNGQDAIIQIVGLVDLSTASYNQSIGTLEIA
jgi:RTX calcium-binding nonapeptide repeat (4 copies)